MWVVKTSGPYSAMVDEPDVNFVLLTSSNARAIRGKSAQRVSLGQLAQRVDVSGFTLLRAR